MRKQLVILLILSSSLSYMQCSKQTVQEVPTPSGLLCELLRKPEKLVITEIFPDFGWVFTREGICQTGYWILVASTPELIQKNQADLWDSNSVRSSKPVDVVYGGKAKEPNYTYYWKVKVWSRNDMESAYINLQGFNTGKFSGRSDEWPGQSHFIELWQDHWVSKNRQTASFHQQDPVLSQFVDSSHYVEVPLKAGRHHYLFNIPPHTSRSLHTQTLASFYPGVLPFRFAKIYCLTLL